MIAAPYELDEDGMDCYVCLEPCQTLSPCKCSDLYLHQNCYAKLLAYDNFYCTVCREMYPINIKDVYSSDEDVEENLEMGEDEPSEPSEPKNPVLCRVFVPIQCRKHRERQPHIVDVYVNGLRHLIAIWILTCALSRIHAQRQEKLDIVDFLNVFSWIYVGEWIFSGICYSFLTLFIGQH